MPQLLCTLPVILVAASNSLGDELRSIARADRVSAIFTEDWGLRSRGKPKLVLAAWDDGHVVWSHDRLHGGESCRSATVDPKRFILAIERLRSIGAFDIPRFSDAKFGPDSQFTNILIHDGEQKLKMCSWHELSRSNGKTVATDHGILALPGHLLLSALSDEPSGYLGYRHARLEMRVAAANLIPASGEETKGGLKMRSGTASWVTQAEAEP